LPVHETVEKDHGRIEVRRYAVGEALDWLPQTPEWPGLSAVGRVESIRQIGNTTTTECRYYLCSFADLAHFAETVRGHGGIENREHWVLDVQFGEDANRTRKPHSAANRGLVRRVALNLLRRHPTDQDSLRRHQRRACLNDDYRACLLFGTSVTT
jgi:predicted transposase YbfD/YdcC